MSFDVIGGAVALPDGTPVPLSKGLRAGDFLFFSGQLAFTDSGALLDGDITAQTEQCLENTKALLETAGASLGDVVKATIWLTNSADFKPFNEVYGRYFASTPPTRSCVISELVIPGALVEIEVMAYAPVGS